MKKLTSIVMAAALTASIFTACGKPSTPATTTDTTAETTAETAEAVPETADETGAVADDVITDGTSVRVGALSGPTAMGMIKVMSDDEAGLTTVDYDFQELSTDPAAFVAPLVQGDIDIAAVPSNLASVIYNKSEGAVEVLAINTLGVLNIVERGESINSIADLAGCTLYATGEGATPEYTLRYLLASAGLDADTDLTIQWCADTTEALSYIQNDEEAIAMLPQPFVTVAMTQVEGLRPAINFNEAWAETEAEGDIVTGVVVARKEFVETHPDTVAAFLEDYRASVDFVNANTAEAAEMVAHFGILPKAPIAEKALPNCSITFIEGEEMKASLSSYLQILFDQNPAAIGGNMPGDDFYYIAE